MSRFPAIWRDPQHHIRSQQPDLPVLYFSPEILRHTVAEFVQGFPGIVSYAVKANDSTCILENMIASGIRVFDVASPHEMALIRSLAPDAVLNYNNPIRSAGEIELALQHNVDSYSVDCASELLKLIKAGVPLTAEVSVRLKLPLEGAAYNFGDKFGAKPEDCIDLLKQVATAGFRPAMTFHPGTQCNRPDIWEAYVQEVAKIARAANVDLERLNVGGGFAARRDGAAPNLPKTFSTIERAVSENFGETRPALLCEPGRALVTDCMVLGTRVKAVRDTGAIYLNDGIYGALAEMPVIGMTTRVAVFSSQGTQKSSRTRDLPVFGPTCDSLDRLPGHIPLPASVKEGDYILFGAMGAYSTATTTRFNGYGAHEILTVKCLGAL